MLGINRGQIRIKTAFTEIIRYILFLVIRSQLREETLHHRKSKMNNTHGGQPWTGHLNKKQKSHFMEKLKFLFTDSEEGLLVFSFWHTCSLLKSSFQSLLLLSLFLFFAKKAEWVKSHWGLKLKIFTPSFSSLVSCCIFSLERCKWWT